ncbi:MAG TPA: MarR family transcriptional regulator [Acidimicrobiales bacterium]|nr:MarR family transcriptional regulator [Acidimicrobiales bacterium]
MDPVLHDERITAVGLFIEAYDALMRALDDASVPANFGILLRLGRSEGQRLRMSDLAAQTGLSPSGLSRAIDRLSAEGLVERTTCPEDARGAFAQLTPKGNKVTVAAVKRHLDALQSNYVEVLSAEERHQLESVCRTLRDRLNPCATAGTGSPSSRSST